MPVSEDAREIAQRIVREVLAAHDATRVDAPAGDAPATDMPGADVPATGAAAAAAPPPRGGADDVADALDDSPARQAAKRIVAEVLAAHAEASRSAPDGLPVAAEAEAAGPASATPVLQPVAGRSAVRPAEPAPPSVRPEDADVAEDAAAIARRIVASVLATQAPEGPPPIPAGLRRPPSIEDAPRPEAADDPAGDDPAGDDPAGDDPAGDDPAGDDLAAEEQTVEGRAVDGEVWVLSPDAAAEHPAATAGAEVAGDAGDEADDEPLFGADAEVGPLDRAVEVPDDGPTTDIAADIAADDEPPGHRGAVTDDLTADHPSGPDEDTWLFGGPSRRGTVGEDRVADPASEPTALIGAFDPDGSLPFGDAPTGIPDEDEDEYDPDPTTALFAPTDEPGHVDGSPDRTAVLAAEVDRYPDEATGAPLTTLAREDDDLSGHEPLLAGPAVQPRRRTARWLIASILGAIALAVLLPLAVEALRSLVALS